VTAIVLCVGGNPAKCDNEDDQPASLGSDAMKKKA
jgi:hypothetical protein